MPKLIVQDKPMAAMQDTAEQWTMECNELLGQVLETQAEIATLLKDSSTDTDSLQSLKKQCDEELVELQEDTWKLQLFVELQRMGQQLESLASHDDSNNITGTKEESCSRKPTTDLTDSNTRQDSQHQAELHDLDREIADLDKQLVEARAELQGLLHDKVALEADVVLVGEQMAALAVDSK